VDRRNSLFFSSQPEGPGKRSARRKIGSRFYSLHSERRGGGGKKKPLLERAVPSGKVLGTRLSEGLILQS